MGGLLDELRRAGDQSADAVISELAQTEQIREVSRILRHLVDNDQPVPEELPPSIGSWLHETAELPDWVDCDRFERGCLSVMAPGSLDSGGRGIRKIQKVRLLHAGIRHLVTTSRRWDVAGDGVPICQEDLAGTLMSFSAIVVDALRRLGVRVDDDEAEDYYYRWRAIGQMLGIDAAAIPPDLAAARELTDLIARRNHHRSEE